MLTLRVAAVALGMWGVAHHSYGQDSAVNDAPLPASRLLAAVREYPPDALQALIRVMREPEIARQIASDATLLDHPHRIHSHLDADLRAAIETLRGTPGALAVVAANPDAAEDLAGLYAEAPEGVLRRLSQIRDAYRAAESAAAADWQRRIESRSGALAKYGELVTAFCREQLRTNRNFRVAAVRRVEYYAACPPSPAVMAWFEDNRAQFAELDGLLSQWWRSQASNLLDDRAQSIDASFTAALGHLAAAPRAARADMWRASVGEPAESALVPIIMQPPDDQPREARLARAVAEHARLWARPPIPRSDQQGRDPQSDRRPYDVAPDGFAEDFANDSGVVMDDPSPSDDGGGAIADDDPRILPPARPLEPRVIVQRERYDDYPSRYGYDVSDPYYDRVYSSYRLYWSNVGPYYCGYPTWSPIYGWHYPGGFYGGYGVSVGGYYVDRNFAIGLRFGDPDSVLPVPGRGWCGTTSGRLPCGHSHVSRCTSYCRTGLDHDRGVVRVGERDRCQDADRGVDRDRNGYGSRNTRRFTTGAPSFGLQTERDDDRSRNVGRMPRSDSGTRRPALRNGDTAPQSRSFDSILEDVRTRSPISRARSGRPGSDSRSMPDLNSAGNQGSAIRRATGLSGNSSPTRTIRRIGTVNGGEPVLRRNGVSNTNSSRPRLESRNSLGFPSSRNQASRTMQKTPRTESNSTRRRP